MEGIDDPRVYILRDGTLFERFISFLLKLDRTIPWEVTVKRWVPRRSSEQNARLWALHSAAAKVTGYSAEEMHELMLCRFFGTKEIAVRDQTIQVPLKRSSQRNKREFAEFMEATEAFYISELGVFLP